MLHRTKGWLNSRVQAMIPKFRGTVEEGKLKLINKDKFDEYLRTLKKDVEIIVKPFRALKDRSNWQNRYYWFVVQKLGDELGYTKDEMHEILRALFLSENKQIGTYTYLKTQSTTALSTIEMESYLGQIRDFALNEFDFYVPLPNEVDFE